MTARATEVSFVPAEFVAVIVYVPFEVSVGVPLITQVEEFIERPAGRDKLEQVTVAPLSMSVGITVIELFTVPVELR